MGGWVGRIPGHPSTPSYKFCREDRESWGGGEAKSPLLQEWPLAGETCTRRASYGARGVPGALVSLQGRPGGEGRGERFTVTHSHTCSSSRSGMLKEHWQKMLPLPCLAPRAGGGKCSG